MDTYYEVTFKLETPEGKAKPSTTLVAAASTAEAEIRFAKSMSAYTYEITMVKKSRISSVQLD